MLLVVLAGCSVDGVYTSERSLLGADPDLAGNIVTVKPGEVLIKSAVVYPMAAQIERAIAVDMAGLSFEVESMQMLEKVQATSGRFTDLVGPDPLLFCAQPERNEIKLFAEQMLGTLITSALQKTDSQTRFCVLDSDKDGAVESALLVGANRKNDQMIHTFDAAPYQLVQNAEAGDDSVATITYLGKKGVLGRFTFELEVIESGQTLEFDNKRVQVSSNDLPQSATQFGARFTIIDYDINTDEISVRIDTPIRHGFYRVVKKSG